MADFSPAALSAAAGVDPWALHQRLDLGDPAAIQDAALGFRRTGALAVDATDIGDRADRELAAAFRNNGSAVFNAPASTAQGIRLLGERGQNMEEAARALVDVATTLAESTSRSRERVRALEADLQNIAALYAGAVRSIVAGAPGAAATAATAEQRYQQMAVDAVRTAAGHVQAEIDDYTAVLTNRGARLDSLGYAPSSPTADPETDVDDDGLLSDLTDLAADVGNAVASFGNAVLHNPEAAAGLVLGIGAVLAGGSMATGGVAVSGTGVGAVAGVPAATAGAALVATGGALVVASAGELGAGAQGTDRVTPFDPRSLEDPTSLRGASPQEVRDLVPEGWIERPLKKGQGTRFMNPDRPGEAIMIEEGWPGAADPLHGGPYVRISRNGVVERVPLEGNPVLGP